MRVLAQAEPGDNYALESLVYLPTRLFSARSQIILVSPMNNDDLHPLLRLRSHGYEVMAVCPNPLDYATRLRSQKLRAQNGRKEKTRASEPNPSVLRLAQIERALLFGNLRRAGIQVVDWKVDQPLSKALHAVLIQPSHGRMVMEVSQ
jgi:uncharacterized protein (DUF58 family)